MKIETEWATAATGSALRRAAIAGDMDALHHLLDAGVAVDTLDSNGWTALMLAAKYGRTEVVQYLIKRGAETNRRNNFTRTALHCAAHRGHAELVRCLLRYGADVSERYTNGCTPLIMAASHLEALQVLVAAGAEINASDNDGATALWHATYQGSMNSALFLLDKGAIIRLPRNLLALAPHAQYNRNPINWAKLRKQDELVRRLEMAIVYDLADVESETGDEVNGSNG